VFCLLEGGLGMFGVIINLVVLISGKESATMKEFQHLAAEQ
jgi:hypothetical protein